MVKDALRGYLALASGVTEVTAARARAAARTLVEQGESTAGQVTALAEDLVATSRRNREGLLLIVRHEVEATLRRLGLGAAGDLDALSQRVRRLEQALREAERAGGTTSTSSTGGRPTVKKAAAKQAASGKRPAAKKPSSRKSSSSTKTTSSTKTASARKASAGKKATASRSASKKTTRRTTTAAKKAATTKRTQKRAGAKKTSAGRRRS